MLSTLISFIANDYKHGNKVIHNSYNSLILIPIRVLATYILSPVLLIIIIFNSKSLVRKLLGVFGLLLALFASILLCYYFSSIGYLLLVVFTFGIIYGIGILLGSLFSIVVKVLIVFFVFNLLCYLTLILNKRELMQYLKNEVISD